MTVGLSKLMTKEDDLEKDKEYDQESDKDDDQKNDQGNEQRCALSLRHQPICCYKHRKMLYDRALSKRRYELGQADLAQGSL